MTRKLVFISDLSKSDCSATSSTTSLSNSDNSRSINTSHNNSSINNKSYSLLPLDDETDKSTKYEFLSSKPKAVTSFDELQSLKAGSRLPIDIRNYKNDTKPVKPTEKRSADNKLSDYEIISRLKNLAKTTQSTQKTKLVVPSSDQKENRKYFSFMTTNKQFTELSQSRRSTESHNSNSEHLVSNKSERISKMNSRLSSSSSASSTCSQNGSDSGCGSSIAARSYILSESNDHIYSHSSKSIQELPTPGSDDNMVMRMKSLCEKFFVKNTSSKQLNMNKTLPASCNQKEMTKVYPENPIQKKPRSKYVTILFDYETCCQSYTGVKSSFKVCKGERVKVIRDYERDFLVATIGDGRIGFVPKDYTVDLKEVEKRFKLNLKQQSRSRVNFCNLSVHDDYENLKLTHL